MNGVILRTNNLIKRFGSFVAVDDLNLEVYQGEIFGFLGPNGAGKTTSISMICGLLKPDAGSIYLHGKPVGSADGELRARVGICPQNLVIWEKLTCLEQLEFIGQMYGMALSAARKNGKNLLESLGLAEKSNKQGGTLSGGMKRRLNLALALVHDPEIVVLDEPEVGLDPQSRVAVREYIHSLARRKTVILTTHDMDEADRLADRVAIIDHGKLLLVDTPANLKQSVGEGDVLDIHLANGNTDAAKQLVDQTGIQIRTEITDRTLTVRGLNLVQKLPQLLLVLTGNGIACAEVRLRENTLEDVFIQLTGRKLREN